MSLSGKISRILYIILVALLAIVLRIWHLAVVQREEKLVQAQKPQQRSLLLRADRGGIYDRFYLPLATNKICYNAAIYYGQISQIPTIAWREDDKGKRQRVYARREYVEQLSKVLAKTLDLDVKRVEDLIYSKASLFPHVPFILKAGISEKEHYRLKALEKDWLGIHAEITSIRSYPLGKAASHLIGTMGAISAKEYKAAARELKELQEAVSLYEQGLESALPKKYSSFEEVYRRLSALKEKAYSLNDLVGKTGCEAQFEEQLRGFSGKKTLEVDWKGRFVRELPGERSPLPGREIVLSISAELQQFAEELLIEEEKRREGKSRGIDPLDKKKKVQKQPWIKGGAILALDPNTGEVLAMASYPRFDPNDFIPSANPIAQKIKQKQISRWLENERFIASLWDGREELKRERPEREEVSLLNWDLYLNLILPQEGPLRAFFQKVSDLKTAIQIQEDFEGLLYFSKAKNPLEVLQKPSLENPECIPFLRRLEPFLRILDSPQDQLFAIDLCRVAVDSSRFTDPLIAQLSSMKISEYRSLCQAFQRLEAKTRFSLQEEFRKNAFQEWRKEHQKSFLAEKRKEEKEKKAFAKPYLDYLDQKERELFQAYWEENRLFILAERVIQEEEFEICLKRLSSNHLLDFLRAFRSYEQLDRPLLGRYSRLRNWKKEQTEKDLAAGFYPLGGFSFLRSYAFQAASPFGSLFKLVTAYEGLRQGVSGFSLVDEWGFDSQAKAGQRQIVSYSLNRTPYRRIYKGGRLPRTSSSRVGKVDLLGAIEQSSNPFFSILAGDFFNDAEDLAHAARAFGLGERSGIELPSEGRGKIPSDLRTNRTGLYSFAIGQHTLLATPLQGAVLLAAIANGGKILKPRIVLAEKGVSRKQDPMDAFSLEHTFVKKELEALGIHFPLFTKIQNRSSQCELRKQFSTEIRYLIPGIDPQLLEGMDRVIWGARGNSRPTTIRSLANRPELLRDYLSLKHQMVGKTSTAELLYNSALNPSNPPQLYTHIWFGAISFEPNSTHPEKTRWDRPELVVIVFSRYGDSGKELAPLAAQMIHKWRAIKQRHLPE